MTRKPPRNFSCEIGAASAAILTLLVAAGLEIRVTESANNGGGDYDHLR